MATAGKTPTRGRKFVALHTRLLGDTDILMMSNDARLLWPLLLLHSADQDLRGEVPADPRRVELFAHIGSVQAAASAMAELTAGGFLIPTADPARLAIRSWAKNQVETMGTEAAPSATALANYRRGHAAGTHTDEPRSGCPQCREASGAHSATEAIEPPVSPSPSPSLVPVQDVLVGVDAPLAWRMSDVLSDVRGELDQSVPSFPTPFAGYMAALSEVEELAPGVAHLSKDSLGSLRNTVLAHALASLLGAAATQPVINAANRGAKALGANGWARYVYAAVESAQVAFENDRQTIAYLAKVAKGEPAYNATASVTGVAA